MNNQSRILYTLEVIAYIFIIIGAINWGLIGLMEFDLVAYLFGDMSLLSRIVYSTVGLFAVLSLILVFSKQRNV